MSRIFRLGMALLVSALGLTRAPTASRAALQPDGSTGNARPLAPDLEEAVAAARQAAQLYQVSIPSSADNLVRTATALLDRLAGAGRDLPSAAAARAATIRAADALRGPMSNAGKLSAPAEQELARLAEAVETVADIVDRTYARSRAIVVSGGVSLGAYQAGFLYYYLRALSFYDRWLGGGPTSPNGRFQIATGASAGSINSFLAAIDGCREPELDPERSLFFRAWANVGLKELIPVKPSPSADGILSSDAFDQQTGPLRLLKDLWSKDGKWAQVPCETALGITATRLSPRRVNALGAKIRTNEDDRSKDQPRLLGLDRMTEKFLLTVSSAGGGGPPTFRSRRIPDANDELYPTLGEAFGVPGPDAIPATLDQVVDLLRASSAFPLAFSPKIIPTTTWTRTSTTYKKEFDEHSRFTDGGFLDNTPLRIAQKLANPTSSQNGPKGQSLTTAPRVLVLMGGAESWRPSAHQVDDDMARKSIFARYLPFVFNFLNTTSDGALIDVFEDDVGGFSYDIPMRAFPLAADPLGHFFTFAEPDFRKFDFYQGMIDAEELVDGHVLEGPSAIPFQNTQTLECFRDYRRRARETLLTVPPPGPACASVDHNLVALLQASVLRRERATAGDDDLEEFTAALKTFHYVYKELADGKELSPSSVALNLRAIFDRLGAPFGSEQPGVAAWLAVDALAPAAIDLWRYRARTYLALGIPGDATLQLAFSKPLRRWRQWSLRLGANAYLGIYPKQGNFMVDGAPTTRRRYPLEIGVGPSFEAVVTQGVLFETGVDIGERSEIFGRDGISYAILKTEGHLSLIFGERLYVSLAPGYLFGRCAGDNGCRILRDKYDGYWPALVPAASMGPANGTLKLSAGWRFLW